MKHINFSIILGGFILSAIAGFSNGVSLVGFSGEAASYVTGNLAVLAREFVDSGFTNIHMIHITVLIITFLLGAMVSGLVLGGGTISLRKRYGLMFLLEGFILLISIPFLKSGFWFGEYLTSFACGLQNAFVTSISGAVVRTTHMTGVVTDIGIGIAKLIHKDKKEAKRLQLHLGLLSGFLAGSLGGIYSYRDLNYTSLLIPAGILIISGSIYFYLRKYHRDILSRLLTDPR